MLQFMNLTEDISCSSECFHIQNIYLFIFPQIWFQFDSVFIHSVVNPTHHVTQNKNKKISWNKKLQTEAFDLFRDCLFSISWKIIYWPTSSKKQVFAPVIFLFNYNWNDTTMIHSCKYLHTYECLIYEKFMQLNHFWYHFEMISIVIAEFSIFWCFI